MTIDWTKVKPGTEIERVGGPSGRRREFIKVDEDAPTFIHYRCYETDSGTEIRCIEYARCFKLKIKMIFEV
jgi:hypothetical protein